jgi:CheY-like chemotaxis protein
MEMSPTILIVDDDESYGILLPRILEKVGSTFALRFVGDGEQAIHYLSGQGKYDDRNSFPLPSLILLDLKMPRVDGFEVLTWKANRNELQSIPVIVWSSSDLPADKEKALALGAEHYIFKPMQFERMAEIFGWLNQFLLNGMEVSRTSSRSSDSNAVQGYSATK